MDYYDIESELTPDERAWRDRARVFVDAEVLPEITAHHRAATLPTDLMRRLGEEQLYAPYLHGHGCAGQSHTAYGLIMAELERADSAVRSCASVQGALAMHAIHAFGSEAQRARWLPRLARGEAVGAFALTEPGHGSDPSGMETHATPDGGTLVLEGEKFWVTNGPHADVIVVWAKGPDGKVAGYLVERDAPGLTVSHIEGKFSLRVSASGALHMDRCRIPADNQLPGARGLRAPLSCLSQARLGIAWGVTGAAADCLHAALAHAQAREQFGRPLAGFQLVQEKLADMLTALTTAQLLALRLTRLREAERATPAQVSLAKRHNVAAALETARTARAVLGGVGVTDRFPVMRHLMNLETVYTYEGTHDIHTLIVGQDLTGHAAFT